MTSFYGKCEPSPAPAPLQDPGLKLGIYDNNDLYYLAGSYDPVVGTLSFTPGVFP